MQNAPKADSQGNLDNAQFMQVLPQGRYASYLKCYLDQIGRNRIHTIFYEDLSKNPLDVMKDLCHFADLDSTYYNDYTFQITNQTETMRNPDVHQKYRSLRFQVRRWTHNKPVIHKTLRAMRRGFEPLYLRLNTRSAESVTLSDETQIRLVDYYQHDVDDLEKLIGKHPPWKPFT